MSALQPSNTTVGDLCTAALQECGRLGVGQTAQAEDMNKAWARLQWMLQEWERKRWLVYQLVTYSILADGQNSWTFGPGGQINTNVVAAWELTGLAPTVAGTGYAVGDALLLSEKPSSSTPAVQLQVVVETVSGGGVATVLVGAAAGQINFLTNANPGDTVSLNGVLFTFISGATSGLSVHVGASVAATIGTELLAAVRAAAAGTSSALLGLAFYGAGAGNSGSYNLNIAYLAGGEDGNDFTLAATGTGTASAATLTGGSDATYQGPLPVSWTQDSCSGTGLNVVFGYGQWITAEGIENPAGTARPAKIESAFLRQMNPPSPNQIDTRLQILQSMEDYNKITMKSLQSFPGCVFLDPGWPLAQLYCNPVPKANQYSVYCTVRQQLPCSFPSLATAMNLPFEYYSAVFHNLALRLRSAFTIPSFPGDPLPGMAKNSLSVLRGTNTAIGRLSMPRELSRNGSRYNVFSDQGS